MSVPRTPLPSRPNALDVVAGLASAISRAADLSHIYAAAFDGLRDGLAVSRASILLFDADEVMRFKAWRGLSDRYRAAVEGHGPWRPDSADASVLCTPDVAADPCLAPILRLSLDEGIRGMALVPLVMSRRVIGTLTCYFDEPRELSPPEAVLAQTIADQVAFAVERTRSEQALVRNEERLRFALDAASMGTWEWDLRQNRVRWSDNVEGIHGLPPGTFDGDFATYEREIHPDDRERVLQSARRAILEGSPHEVEYRIVGPDGTVRWVEGKGRVEFDDAGRPVRMAGVCMAIDRRKRAELDRAALVVRTSLLAEVSAILSRSLDYEQTLQSVAELAVPALADCCIVDIRRDDGPIEAAGLACADPALLAEFRDLRRQHPIRADEPYGPAAVIRTGEPLLKPVIRPGALEVVPDPALRERLRRLDLQSAIVVPIRDAGSIAGTISLLMVASSGRRHCDDDLETALEVAQRAGAAVENARLYRAAQDANRAKNDFLATLSHELRTPLNAILGWARMIERGILPPGRAAHGIASIRRNAEAQSRLIGDILDIARIRSGKLRIEPQRLDLHSIVAASAETMEAEAEARRVTLEVASQRGLIVEGDPSRLQQVLWNLVSNAIKFTPERGTVRIETQCEAGRAVIVVRDTGVGIEPAFLPHVFDRFRQGDASTTRYHAGLGLGLAITKHIAELHGGRVRAESDGPGHGATFTVELPLYAPGPTGAGTMPSPPEMLRDRPLADRRVLVVDDDADSRQLVAMILTSAGAVVDTAASAAAGYACATARGYDLIVADIAMPGEDGFSLVRRIRARLDGADRMAAIAVTAHAREEDRARALSVGFVAHLAKPFEPERLLEVAASAVRASPTPR
jgi:PAS domain S-box-containing protein